LNQARINHAKFEGLDGGLKGEVIVRKLSGDFELLIQFRKIKSSLPIITHGPLIE